MPDHEADKVPATYRAHLSALTPALPADVRRLAAEVSLHDGLVRSFELDRAAREAHLTLRVGDQDSGYSDLTLFYRGADVDDASEKVLRRAMADRNIELLYDEFDRGDAGWVHRFLLWPYADASVQFKELAWRQKSVAERFDKSAT